MSRNAFLQECKEKGQRENNSTLQEALLLCEIGFTETHAAGCSDKAEDYNRLALMVQGCRAAGGDVETAYTAAIKHLRPSEFEKGVFAALVAIQINA